MVRLNYVKLDYVCMVRLSYVKLDYVIKLYCIWKASKISSFSLTTVLNFFGFKHLKEFMNFVFLINSFLFNTYI